MTGNLSRREALKLGAMAGAGVWLDPSPPSRPAPPAPASDELTDLLQQLLAKHRLPGAVAGVSQGGKVTTAAAGVANLNTGAPMTPEIGFLTGSITKVWHATLVMSLVDEGKVALDKPLIEYLPRLRFGDPEATRVLTLKHMLNHSSGLDAGDYVLELGEGPCTHRLYVEALAKIGQIHRPGEYSSYCNGGWVVAAHLLETLTGKSWRQLMIDRVIGPMGLRRTFVDAEDGVLHGMAVGNLPDRNAAGGHRPVPKLLLPKSLEPAGTTFVLNLEDQLRFARMHLAGGAAENGTRIISAESARAMATKTIDAPYPTVPGFGLGWRYSTPGGEVTLSHGGGSNGGRAVLMVLPGQNLAHASFVNTSSPGGFQIELHNQLTARFGRAVPPSPPVQADGPIVRSRFVGTYRRMTTKVTIREEGEKLFLKSEWILSEAEGTEAYGAGPPVEVEVVALAPNVLARPGVTQVDREAGWMFIEPGADGRYQYLFVGGRLSRRTA